MQMPDFAVYPYQHPATEMCYALCIDPFESITHWGEQRQAWYRIAEKMAEHMLMIDKLRASGFNP